MENIPKIVPKRNEFGLLDIDYIFNEDATVNWKAMIPQEFLYVNPSLKRREEIEKKYKKPYKEIKPIEDKVEDDDLVQLLAAAKFLLKLYGYTSICYQIKESNENYASVNCQIDFIGTYLTEGQPISFEDNASATINNTNGFGQRYLLEMATNRSFARCVRNFLNINIVSKEEENFEGNQDIHESSQTSNTIKPLDILVKSMKDNNISFDFLKKQMVTDTKRKENESAKEWKSIEDIDKVSIFYIIEKIKRKDFIN